MRYGLLLLWCICVTGGLYSLGILLIAISYIHDTW